LLKLKKQLDEAEAKFSTQAPFPIGTEFLLSKLSSNAQDLNSLIDVKTAIAALPGESDLAALLQLCLDGDITVEVRRKRNLAQKGTRRPKAND